jgi:hypothetical protein
MIKDKEYKLHYENFEDIKTEGAYLIRNLDNNNLKIGITNDLERRLKEIKKSFQFCGIEPHLKVECFIEYKDNINLESYLHSTFKKYNSQNEWFSIYNINDIINELQYFKVGNNYFYNKDNSYIKYDDCKNIYKYMIKQGEKENSIICDDWKVYNNDFKFWIYENYYDNGGETLRVNKNIIHKDNNIYSPEMCLLVPKEIHNMTLVKYKTKQNSKGLYRFEHKISHWNTPYLFCDIICDYDNIFKSNFIYNTKKEAIEGFKVSKNKFLNQLNEVYKGTIPENVYNEINKLIEIERSI